jgi:hypothetical protein
MDDMHDYTRYQGGENSEPCLVCGQPLVVHDGNRIIVRLQRRDSDDE